MEEGVPHPLPPSPKLKALICVRQLMWCVCRSDVVKGLLGVVGGRECVGVFVPAGVPVV